MEPVQLADLMGLAVGGFGLLAAGIWAARRKRRASAPAAQEPGSAPEALIHRIELRMEAIEALQESLTSRIGGVGSGSVAEKRLRAVAGQILGLVRDRDAGLEAALAGLDQLRARMRLLERLGGSAEACALLERLEQRVDAIEAAQASAETMFDGPLAGSGIREKPFAELSEQLARLHGQKDAMVETAFGRLAPLEAKLAEVARAAADDGADAARAEARAIAAQLIAARSVAEETRLFADRIALLEVSLPRLSQAQAQLVQALEGQTAPQAAEPPAGPDETDSTQPGGRLEAHAAAETPAAEDDGLWRLPRVISVHAG